MKNPNQLVRAFDKEGFANLLRRAIGSRTQFEFSKISGISNSYLSKYLNQQKEKPPIPQTLRKIAIQAENEVSLDDFLFVAGYDIDTVLSKISKNGDTLIDTDFKNSSAKSISHKIDIISIGALLSALHALPTISFTPLKNTIDFLPGLLIGKVEGSDFIDLWQFHDLASHPNSFNLRMGLIAQTNYHSIMVSSNEHAATTDKNNTEYLSFKKPKISLVTTSEETFLRCVQHPVPSIIIPISIILLDLTTFEIVQETYLKTGYTGNVSLLPCFPS